MVAFMILNHKMLSYRRDRATIFVI